MKITVINIQFTVSIGPVSVEYVQEETLKVAKRLAREMASRETLGLPPVTKSEALHELREIPGVMDVSVVDPEVA